MPTMKPRDRQRPDRLRQIAAVTGAARPSGSRVENANAGHNLAHARRYRGLQSRQRSVQVSRTVIIGPPRRCYGCVPAIC